MQNMYKIEEIKKRLNATTGGNWYTEESNDYWQLFAENYVKFKNPNPLAKIDEQGRELVHPYQIIGMKKIGYYPNKADTEFLNNVKQDIQYLLNLIEEKQ